MQAQISSLGLLKEIVASLVLLPFAVVLLALWAYGALGYVVVASLCWRGRRCLDP